MDYFYQFLISLKILTFSVVQQCLCEGLATSVMSGSSMNRGTESTEPNVTDFFLLSAYTVLLPRIIVKVVFTPVILFETLFLLGVLF